MIALNDKNSRNSRTARTRTKNDVALVHEFNKMSCISCYFAARFKMMAEQKRNYNIGLKNMHTTRCRWCTLLLFSGKELFCVASSWTSKNWNMFFFQALPRKRLNTSGFCQHLKILPAKIIISCPLFTNICLKFLYLAMLPMYISYMDIDWSDNM